MLKKISNQCSRIFRVAVAQLSSNENKEENFRICQALARKAAQQKVQLLCFPECFAYLGSSQQQTLKNAEKLDGPLISKYRELAAENSMFYLLYFN